MSLNREPTSPHRAAMTWPVTQLASALTNQARMSRAVSAGVAPIARPEILPGRRRR